MAKVGRVIGNVSRLWAFPLTKHMPKLPSMSLKGLGSKSKKKYPDDYDPIIYDHDIPSSSLMPEKEPGEGSLMITSQELSDGSRKPPSSKYRSASQRSRGSFGGGHVSVPKGSLAVYVGPELKRYVIPMSYLGMPELRVVMDAVAEEYGHDQKEGGLRIPICEEQDFEQILESCKRRLQIMSKTKRGKHKKHHSTSAVNLA